MTYLTKIIFGEMRSSGVRDVLIYCRDHSCSHHIAISADRWPDQVRLSDIEPDDADAAVMMQPHPEIEFDGADHC